VVGDLPADRSARARAWRLLVSRGFPEDAVNDVLGDCEEPV
jgi:SOS response regulatory protein OraA/RecX